MLVMYGLQDGLRVCKLLTMLEMHMEVDTQNGVHWHSLLRNSPENDDYFVDVVRFCGIISSARTGGVNDVSFLTMNIVMIQVYFSIPVVYVISFIIQASFWNCSPGSGSQL